MAGHQLAQWNFSIQKQDVRNQTMLAGWTQTLFLKELGQAVYRWQDGLDRHSYFLPLHLRRQ
jgi:hypothetical protein